MPRLPKLVDRALDATVVLSFTRLGYRARAVGFDPLPDLGGKAVVVTGANSGLGRQAAEELAELGARVWLVGRDVDRIDQARTEILEAVPGADLRTGIADLGRLDDVRRLAGDILDSEREIHALVSNAGALVHERVETDEGNELTLAVHVLGPFLLAHLLRPGLAAAEGSRIVVVASGGMYASKIDVDDLQSTEGAFNGTLVYGRAKRAQVILAEHAADRLRDEGIAVSTMHPGWADTPGVVESLPRFEALMRPFLRDVHQGADTMVWLAAAADPMSRTGRFFLDRVPRPVHKVPWTKESEADRRALWGAVVELAGVDCDD